MFLPPPKILKRKSEKNAAPGQINRAFSASDSRIKELFQNYTLYHYPPHLQMYAQMFESLFSIYIWGIYLSTYATRLYLQVCYYFSD